MRLEGFAQRRVAEEVDAVDVAAVIRKTQGIRSNVRP
jgi:hypothetical protein